MSAYGEDSWGDLHSAHSYSSAVSVALDYFAESLLGAQDHKIVVALSVAYNWRFHHQNLRGVFEYRVKEQDGSVIKK